MKINLFSCHFFFKQCLYGWKVRFIIYIWPVKLFKSFFFVILWFNAIRCSPCAHTISFYSLFYELQLIACCRSCVCDSDFWSGSGHRFRAEFIRSDQIRYCSLMLVIQIRSHRSQHQIRRVFFPRIPRL